MHFHFTIHKCDFNYKTTSFFNPQSTSSPGGLPFSDPLSKKIQSPHQGFAAEPSGDICSQTPCVWSLKNSLNFGPLSIWQQRIMYNFNQLEH